MTPSLKEPNGDAPDPVVALADKYEADRAYFNATDRDSDDRDHPVGMNPYKHPAPSTSGLGQNQTNRGIGREVRTWG